MNRAAPDPVLGAIAARWPGFADGTAPTRSDLQRLVDAQGARWRLVDPKSWRGTYEQAIAQGCILTRDGSWHDAFNVLAFLSWPLAKAALHARTLLRQRERLASGVGQRGREEDALALIDEAVLVISGPVDMIARFNLARGDGDLAAMDAVVTQGLRVRWFGHALLEHLALGRPGISAGVWTLGLAPHRSDDEALAHEITAGHFTAPCFAPMVPWPHATVAGWIDHR